MAQISADIAKGLSPEHAINRAGVFSKRIALVRQGLGRLRTPQWLALLDRCHHTDGTIKGIGAASPWLLLERIALTMSGRSLTT